MGSPALDLYERSRTATTLPQRKAVLDAFAAATDNWTRSALVAAATEQAPAYVTEALTYDRPQALTDFVVAVLPAALPANAARLLGAAAGAGPGAVALTAAIVRAVARLEGGAMALDAAATQAVQMLLDVPETRAGALAIVAKSDSAGALSARGETAAQLVLRDLRDSGASDDRRVDAASGLLAVPAHRAQALSTMAPMLADATVPAPLKGRLIAALGDNAGPDVDAVMVVALARTKSTLIFDQLVKRPESSLALLAAIEDRTVSAASISPANVGRLRTHPNRPVAQKAAAVFDAAAVSAKPKNDVIAALLPDVDKPGDAAKGRVLFTGACSGCHKLGDLGVNVGPPLNGIGARPRAELLGHIVDPNREVDPTFWQWNITTRQGQSLSGVIAGENAAGLTLRAQAGDVEIRTSDITNRENTRRSFMPEGLEALGAEALRDIITFLELSKSAPEPQAAAGAAGPKKGGHQAFRTLLVNAAKWAGRSGYLMTAIEVPRE